MKVEKSIAELAATILSGRSDLTEAECVQAAVKILRASAGTSKTPVPIAAKSSSPRKRSASEVVEEITRQKNSARKWEAFRRFSTAHLYKSGNDDVLWKGLDEREAKVAADLLKCHSPRPKLERKSTRRPSTLMISDGDVERLKKLFAAYAKLTGRKKEIAVAKKVAKKASIRLDTL